MTDDVKKLKCALIQINKDFINIQTWSGYRSYALDRDMKDEYLTIDISHKELGTHLREALKLSRFVHPLKQEDLDLYLYSPDRAKEWIEYVMKKYGYKTKSKMFKPMLSCYATLYEGSITLEPDHQYTLDGWDRSGLTEADNIIISESCTDEELGVAARLALSRCTSKYV